LLVGIVHYDAGWFGDAASPASGVLVYTVTESPGRRSSTDASWRGAVMRGNLSRQGGNID
jgi:hypothetical protein